MRALVQRVTSAEVSVDSVVCGSINCGILVLLGVRDTDARHDAEWLAHKVANLRIFTDDQGTMNHSLKDVGGSVLVVSQFTLYGDTRKGLRPSYIQAARPDMALPLYEYFVSLLRTEHGLHVQTGVFGAMMDVQLVNSGPVTLLIESPE